MSRASDRDGARNTAYAWWLSVEYGAIHHR